MRSNEITAPQDLSAFGEELSDTELAEVNGGARVIVIVFGDGTVVVIVQR
jgi:bacteriocin-like protein